MQDLQRDVAALCVHGPRDRLMLAGCGSGGQRARSGLGPPLDVGREPTGHDQAHAAGCPLREVVGQVAEPLRLILEARVHRAHQDAVAQCRPAEVEGCEQVRVGGFGIRCRHVYQCGPAALWAIARVGAADAAIPWPSRPGEHVRYPA